MLKRLGPLHTPDLLYVLASMGHGNDLALVDANFPAISVARRLVRLDGADLPDAIAACLELLPLDTFVDNPAVRMQQVHAPDELPEVQQLCQAVIEKAEGRHVPFLGIESDAFYGRAKEAFAVIVTSERRLYGDIIVKKGVVKPA
jgi:L-fucose mutarotase